MSMNGVDIIRLRQTAGNEWQAKYHDKDGIHTVRISIKEKNTTHFFCTCNSEKFPCRHIANVEEAIAEQLTANDNNREHTGLRLENYLKDVPAEKLRDFLNDQAKFNIELYNAALLEFVAKGDAAKEKKSPKGVQTEEDLNIYALDQMLEKARNFMRLENYDEVVSIFKKIIREYFKWINNVGEDIFRIFNSK